MQDLEKRQLLDLARRALTRYLRDGETEPDRLPDWPDPTPRGVFVTLRNQARLRGCIGTFAPTSPLPQTVWTMAVAAAQDPRFVDRPVRFDELPSLRIEISVLSPLEKTSDPRSLVVGRHGIYIRGPRGHGCFLPQVATEFGWDAGEFLSRCCSEKAGLAPDAWQRPDTEVYLFTVDHMDERDVA
ncbi:MAG: AmmeMemoRadiSam system protein A [Phycisphaerae bacterium]|nr:AmmeMemoRadiSam system protein A [Phycisphaerae bacterium]